MTKPVAIPESRQPVLARPSDSFARLTPLGWTGGLIFIVALLAASFILAGYFVVYWRTADMDFMVVYSALQIGRAHV